MRRDATQVLAMCAWAKKQISKVEDRAKQIADVTFPDEKVAGVVEDRVVSYTSRVSRKPADPFEVISDGAFVDWVEQRWPTEIERTVRKSWLDELYRRATEIDSVHPVDESGEVCEFAKINDPIVYTTTRLTKDADAALAPLLQGLPLSDLADFIEGLDD